MSVLADVAVGHSRRAGCRSLEMMGVVGAGWGADRSVQQPCRSAGRACRQPCTSKGHIAIDMM